MRLFLACLALLSAACASQETSRPQAPPYAPYPPAGATPAAAPNQYASQAGMQRNVPTAPPPGPGQMAPLGTVTADPAAIQNILAGALAGGTAALGALVGGEQAPIEQGIKAQAESSARGMRPEGPLVSARLPVDGHAATSLTLQPGSCYTIVGFGGPGVFDFRIHVMTSPPLPPQILAESNADAGPTIAPVVGSNETCLRSPLPLPLVVQVDLNVARGQGFVGAQVYRR